MILTKMKKLETQAEIIERLAFQYMRNELKLAEKMYQHTKKPLAAGSVIIHEAHGRFWRFHPGHTEPFMGIVVSPSVYPANEAVSLEQMTGV